MPGVRFTLLGALGIEDEGRNLRLAAPPMTFPLLGYLLLHRGKTLSRDAVAFTLWSEYDEPEAKVNLRRHVYSLTRLLPVVPKGGAPWLIVDAKTLRWNVDADATIDADEFERRLNAGDREGAAALYAGDYLQQYEAEWILPERERLRGLHVENLVTLVAEARSDRRPQRALTYARQLQQYDPWREDALRECAALRYELGDGAGAIADLDAFATRLREELDAEMMPETQALREMIAREERRRIPGAAIAPRNPSLAWRTLPFVGRTRELDTLREAWNEARGGRGGAVFVAGEAGIGKSRLVSALRTIAQEDGGLVLQGTGSIDGSPYQPLLEALAPAAGAIAGSEVAPVWYAALAAVLPELRGHRTVSALTRLPPEREQARLYEAFARAIGALATLQPLLLVIEDVHRSGAATFDLLERIARDAAARSCVLLLTYRSESVGRGAPLRAMIENLRRAHVAQRVSLGPLSGADVDELFRLLAGEEADIADAASVLYRRSDGNPFFLGELLRDGIERGDLQLEGRSVRYTAGANAHVSSGVREVIESRLHRITPESRSMLELAAVIGRSFSLELLLAVAGSTAATTIAALLELADHQLIAESADGDRFTFLHEMLQSTAYELIAPEGRRWHHLRVAEVIEAAAAGGIDEVAARLAFHFERSGDGPRAAAYHLRAAKHALRLNANAEALHHCDRVLALSPPPAVRADALFIREEVHRRRAEHDARSADLDELAALAESDPELELEIFRRRMLLAHATGDRDREAALITSMLQREPAMSTPLWTAVAEHAQARQFTARGQIDAARAALERALAVPEFAADPRSGEAYYELVVLGLHSGGEDLTERAAERALAAAQRLNDAELELRIANARKRLPHRFETPDQAYRASRELLQHAVAIGDVYGTMEARYLSGVAAMATFKIAEADEHLRAAEELSARASTPKARVTVVCLRGILAFAVGDFDAALEHFARSKVLAVASADRYMEFLGDLNAASAWLMAGDPQRACDIIASIETLNAEVGSPALAAALRCIRGAALCRLGAPEGVAELEAGVQEQRQLKRTATCGNDLAELALAYVERGDAPAALAVADELVGLSDTAYCGAAHPEFMLWAAARAHDLAGNAARARDARARAYAWFTKHEEQIENPRWKRCFAAMSFNRKLVEEIEAASV